METSFITIQLFRGGYIAPGSIFIATTNDIGAILTTPTDKCLVIQTNNLETFITAKILAKLLYHSHILLSRSECSRYTHNVPTLKLEAYSTQFFYLRKKLTVPKIELLKTCIDDIEYHILQCENEIKELNKSLYVLSSDALK